MSDNLEFLFHPRSIALVGISATNPDHWTHSLLDGLLKMEFPDPIYPVNFKGGEMHGLKVYQSSISEPQRYSRRCGLCYWSGPGRFSNRTGEKLCRERREGNSFLYSRI